MFRAKLPSSTNASGQTLLSRFSFSRHPTAALDQRKKGVKDFRRERNDVAFLRQEPLLAIDPVGSELQHAL